MLQEKTEEVIEDEFLMYDVPVESMNTLKKPKTLPELSKIKTITLSQIAEENKLRDSRVKDCLEHLHTLNTQDDLKLDISCQFRDRRSNLDLRDRIIRTSENILDLYNIRLNVVNNGTIDSLIAVDPVKDRFAYAKFLQTVVQEISRFPYSFYKKIGLSMITVCQKIQLFKDRKDPIVKRKLLSGMFILDHLSNENEIINTFYKVLFFYLKDQIPDLDTHWAKVYTKKSRAFMNSSTNVIITQCTKVKDYYEDQYPLFKNMVRNPNATLKNESNIVRIKCFKLKDSMEKIDPDGINLAWWRQQGFNMIVGSLDHI